MNIVRPEICGWPNIKTRIYGPRLKSLMELIEIREPLMKWYTIRAVLHFNLFYINNNKRLIHEIHRKTQETNDVCE